MGNRRNNYYDATIRRMVTESFKHQEEAFSELHCNDPDEALLKYLQDSALDLGHTPHEKEILGFTLILSRFGSWQEAICKAGLAPPSTPDKQTLFRRFIQEEQLQKDAYAQKKAQKKELARMRERERIKKRQVSKSDQPGNPEIINESCP